MDNPRFKKEHGNKIKVTKKYVRDMMRLLAKKEYEMNFPKDAKDIALKVLKFVHNPSHRSHANGYVIKINFGARWHWGRPEFVEYSSFSKDPVIGTIKTDSAWDELLVLVAHELAHHVHDRYSWRIPRYRRVKDNGHGDIFKSIYRYLRRDFVNKKINTDYTNHGVWDLPVKPKVSKGRTPFRKLCKVINEYNDTLVRIAEEWDGLNVYTYDKDSDPMSYDPWMFDQSFYGPQRFTHAYRYVKNEYSIQLPKAFRQ